jgi:hypothetical protein
VLGHFFQPIVEFLATRCMDDESDLIPKGLTRGRYSGDTHRGIVPSRLAHSKHSAMIALSESVCPLFETREASARQVLRAQGRLTTSTPFKEQYCH